MRVMALQSHKTALRAHSFLDDLAVQHCEIARVIFRITKPSSVWTMMRTRSVSHKPLRVRCEIARPSKRCATSHELAVISHKPLRDAARCCEITARCCARVVAQRVQHELRLDSASIIETLNDLAVISHKLLRDAARCARSLRDAARASSRAGTAARRRGSVSRRDSSASSRRRAPGQQRASCCWTISQSSRTSHCETLRDARDACTVASISLARCGT